MECTQQILEILGSLGIILASIVAFFGINSWRRELRERKQYELAEEVLTLFYEARDKISAIRSPGGYVGEGESRKPNPKETPEEKEALDSAYVVFERYQKNQETFNRLHALRYRFMAIFETNKAKPFFDLNNITNEIFTAARMLGTLWHMRSQTYLPRSKERYDKIIKDIEKYEAIFWWDVKVRDSIEQKVEKTVKEMDEICRPILRGKQSWFSKLFKKKIEPSRVQKKPKSKGERDCEKS